MNRRAAFRAPPKHDRNPRQLRFVSAEEHPAVDLDRVRYEAPDGHIEEGIGAIARALEHVHLA